MRILIAPDKFKGVQTAREVAQNVASGLREILPNVAIDLAPIADGGEGTAQVICEARDGPWIRCRVHDPLGRVIEARYAWLEKSATAILEMSEAAGMKRISFTERKIDEATTFGVGEMILDAAEHGARKIIVGLGGSATNDGGFGMARALGFRFLAENGKELCGKIDQLAQLKMIEKPKKLQLPRIVAAVDVRNPLLGSNGATYVFGPQKGANKGQLEILEKALTQLAKVSAKEFGFDYTEKPGAGAAGGLGFGLMTFCGAEIRNGFDVVADAIDLQERMKAADVVITGEGKLDRQTLEGKGPAGVAQMARRLGKCVYAIVGLAEEDKAVRELFEGVYVIGKAGMSDAEKIRQASPCLQAAARRLAESLAS